MPTFFQILILSIVQGACELLPVSSSAHVIVAEKLMGLDPTTPAMTMLLVMMHTGTMFAVIAYFWKSWLRDYFSDGVKLKSFVMQIVIATICTGVVGFGLKVAIEKIFMRHAAHAEVEALFGNLPLIAGSLAAVGILIIIAGLNEANAPEHGEIQTPHSVWIGIVQGICLPFRGFSRSGSTISTGLLLGLPKQKLEEFSFALAVVLTPVVIGKEALRLVKAPAQAHTDMAHLFAPSGVGMALSFAAGFLALKLLTRLLEGGKWKFFGFYCILAAAAVFCISLKG